MNFSITPLEAAELLPQSAFTGTSELMNIDLMRDSCKDGWLHIRLSSGKSDWIPIARIDGLTLFAAKDKLSVLKRLRLNYFVDLICGDFLISAPHGSESCACGSCFRFLIN